MHWALMGWDSGTLNGNRVARPGLLAEIAVGRFDELIGYMGQHLSLSALNLLGDPFIQNGVQVFVR